VKKWQIKLYEIIFEADTPLGKLFDIALLISILSSVMAVMLESVSFIDERFHEELRIIEWVFTIGFSIEYIARIISSKKPFNYIFSFYGVIDLLAIVPTYLSLIVAGSQSLLVIRTIRLLRVFRIFKLAQYIGQGKYLMAAMKASREKITVFVGAVLAMTVVTGTLMYLIEGQAHGFTSIPRSIYWAIVTLTTVGYGDISPQTPIGQFLASIVMMTGYAIIAVPTGIVTVELAKAEKVNTNTQVCTNCGYDHHDDDARFCKKCGENLDPRFSNKDNLGET
jgi:voltage-gated potassium channel